MKAAFQIVLQALTTGLLCGACISLIATTWEWVNNPGGIFRGESGTHWGFVLDTAVSWFLPVLFWISGLVLVALSAVRLLLTKKT